MPACLKLLLPTFNTCIKRLLALAAHTGSSRALIAVCASQALRYEPGTHIVKSGALSTTSGEHCTPELSYALCQQPGWREHGSSN